MFQMGDVGVQTSEKGNEECVIAMIEKRRRVCTIEVKMGSHSVNGKRENL